MSCTNTVLCLSKESPKEQIGNNLFLSGSLSVQRYDIVRYPSIQKLTNKMKGFYWSPNELNMSKDVVDFKQFSEAERHIFTANIRRQIILDSVQGRSPLLAFLPICSNSELEAAIIWWSAFEQIHSETYTHNIRNVYPNPSVVFDSIFDIKEIVDCASDVSACYDKLIEHNNIYLMSGSTAPTLEHKEALWMALMAVNALEGIRFYVSFLCTWNFAEQGKIEAIAKGIKLICRDENLHLALSQQIIQILPKEDPDFLDIKERLNDKVVELFESVERQEKEWADFLFKDGSMIGLNAAILKDYVSYITKRRMKAIGLKYRGESVNVNPCPWSSTWIGGDDLQVAPQEVEISSYLVGKMNTSFDASSLGVTI
jgi:ribonucleoside-diphosphate reductase beta chain